MDSSGSIRRGFFVVRSSWILYGPLLPIFGDIRRLRVACAAFRIDESSQWSVSGYKAVWKKEFCHYKKMYGYQASGKYYRIPYRPSRGALVGILAMQQRRNILTEIPYS